MTPLVTRLSIMLLVSVLNASTTWRCSILRVNVPRLLGIIQLCLDSNVPVRLTWAKVTAVCGEVFKCIKDDSFPTGWELVFCDAVATLIVQCTTVLEIRMWCVVPCKKLMLDMETCLLATALGLTTLELWWASTVST